MTTTIFSQQPPIEPGVSHELAIWRAKHYSDVRYGLNLTLEKMSPVLKGEINIGLSVASASADAFGQQIILDWRKIKGKEDAYSIKDVELNGKPAEFEEINEHLVIKNAKQGENVIKLNFTSPISTSGSAITRYIDKEDSSEYIYSLFVASDASTAFPVFDQPDLKAKFQLNLTVPKEWKVVSNTAKTGAHIRYVDDSSENTENRKEVIKEKFKFAETKPISTYVFAFAAGDFAELKDERAEMLYALDETNSVDDPDKKDKTPPKKFVVPKVYVRKSQAEKFKQHSAEVFRLNRECIKYLEGYFDYKFPFPKYDLVLIPEFPFGGMEHAGATFLRESSIIFPSEPTKNDIISRANLIFHEAAHQWFGDTVTMKWFDDLWLKEGFATFMGYKAMEKIMPEFNAWKVFYERTKQTAYLTDSTKGTTPIYQEIANLSAAKSAYGNIVYNKAPAFLRQSEFYLGEKEFQTAVRSFLKKNEFKNATWQDLVGEFETVGKSDLNDWARKWINQRGTPLILTQPKVDKRDQLTGLHFTQVAPFAESIGWQLKFKIVEAYKGGNRLYSSIELNDLISAGYFDIKKPDLLVTGASEFAFTATIGTANFIFPNYQDYGYGIFLLDEKSRKYILANVQNEEDDFLRSMMYGSLWDSVREAEMDPRGYVELVIKNVAAEKDEMIVASMLGRANTALNYYINSSASGSNTKKNPSAHADGTDLVAKLEKVLINKMQTAETQSQKITFYRAFLNVVSSENGRELLKDFLKPNAKNQKPFEFKTKDKFDIVTKLLILGDKDAPKLLAELEKTETSDDAKRYAYAAKAGIGTAENKSKYFNDFVANKEISESWIEAAFGSFNSTKHSDLTLPYLEKALAELPNLKRNRKIFFVNGWLSAFIGGQKSDKALAIVNKFLADNPKLDKDLRLKILENVDVIERAVKIRGKFSK